MTLTLLCKYCNLPVKIYQAGVAVCIMHQTQDDKGNPLPRVEK